MAPFGFTIEANLLEFFTGQGLREDVEGAAVAAGKLSCIRLANYTSAALYGPWFPFPSLSLSFLTPPSLQPLPHPLFLFFFKLEKRVCELSSHIQLM